MHCCWAVWGGAHAVEPVVCPILRFFPPQEHQNEDLYEKAVSILETYFECEEGDDQNLAPQMAGNQYAFGQQAAQVSRGEGVMGLLLGPRCLLACQRVGVRCAWPTMESLRYPVTLCVQHS